MTAPASKLTSSSSRAIARWSLFASDGLRGGPYSARTLALGSGPTGVSGCVSFGILSANACISSTSVCCFVSSSLRCDFIWVASSRAAWASCGSLNWANDLPRTPRRCRAWAISCCTPRSSAYRLAIRCTASGGRMVLRAAMLCAVDLALSHILRRSSFGGGISTTVRFGSFVE